MSSIDTFVNSNEHNVAFTITDEDDFDMLFEILPQRFSAMVRCDWVDEAADPVLVYVRDGKPVAWYDMELAQGYIAS